MSMKNSSRRQLLYDLERHAFEASPLTQLFPLLVKKNSKWWTSLDDDGNPVDSPNAKHGADQVKCLPAIPDTVVWENNIPKGWYYYDTKELQIVRKKVETKQIQRVFLKKAKYENDVVATLYSIPLGGEKDEMEFQFITAVQLPSVLFENRHGKGTSILQYFIYPLAMTHNDMIQAIWTPTVMQVSRRQNIYGIFDERVDVNQRCVTFEGRTHDSSVLHSTSRLQAKVRQACDKIAQHFKDCTDNKFQISRMVLHFKMSESSQLLLLFSTSARVIVANVNQLEEEGGSLHRRYRVSLELATKFFPRGIVASHSASEKTLRSPTVDFLNHFEDQQYSMHVVSPVHYDMPDPYVGPRTTKAPIKASRLGFLPPNRVSLSPNKQNRRPQSVGPSAKTSTVHSIMVEAVKLQKMDGNVSFDQKLRTHKLVDRCVKKIGTSAARMAYLSAKPVLQEWEKMELLSLKLEDTAKQQVEPTEQPSLSVLGAKVMRDLHEKLSNDVLVIQDHLQEVVYRCQSHFDVEGPSKPFILQVNPTTPTTPQQLAELLILEEFDKQSAQDSRNAQSRSLSIGTPDPSLQFQLQSSEQYVNIVLPWQNRVLLKLQHQLHNITKETIQEQLDAIGHHFQKVGVDQVVTPSSGEAESAKPSQADVLNDE